ncbi:MAG: hypothetical protein WC322_06940 [Candidatus Paceibacterota bacterium]
MRYTDAELETISKARLTTGLVTQREQSLARELLSARKVIEAAKEFIAEDSIMNLQELEYALEDYERGYD